MDPSPAASLAGFFPRGSSCCAGLRARRRAGRLRARRTGYRGCATTSDRGPWRDRRAGSPRCDDEEGHARVEHRPDAERDRGPSCNASPRWFPVPGCISSASMVCSHPTPGCVPRSLHPRGAKQAASLYAGPRCQVPTQDYFDRYLARLSRFALVFRLSARHRHS